MKRRVVIYCPDRHILYDGRTPDEVGVGGGITARVRMARALARRGHDVHMLVNCPRVEDFDGVHYWPLNANGPRTGDVLIANTSGGDLDLTPAVDLAQGFGLRLAWIHGTIQPAGFDRLAWDWAYAVSNFIAGHVQREWGVPARRIFVAYNAFEEAHFTAAEAEGIARDPYRLIYAGHPSKGLPAAIELVKALRASDPRYTLRVFGGNRLWGQTEEPILETEAVTYGGLVGQRQLAQELLASGVSVQLQTREEPGALLIPEVLRAGCYLVASPVGCFPEFVMNDQNGVLIEGDPESTDTIRRAAEGVRTQIANLSAMNSLYKHAATVPWSTETMAEVWEQHWDWVVAGGPTHPDSTAECTACGGVALGLADGAHCLACSYYLPSWLATAAPTASGIPM